MMMPSEVGFQNQKGFSGKSLAIFFQEKTDYLKLKGMKSVRTLNRTL
jgi:hypothetical protein